MRIKGKIIEFDGSSGILVDGENVRYIFTSKDVVCSKVHVGDKVTFESEVFETIDVKMYIARFINK